MDRRNFTKFALSGLAFSFLTDSMGRAALPTQPQPATPVPVPPAPAPAPPQPKYAALLDRAKAALDHHADAFTLRDRVALVDFDAPSKDLRMHVVDLVGGQANSYLVSHGRGSDPAHSGWLHSFSNEFNSLASCRGAFRTEAEYVGQHGRSMRLTGLDPQNDNAEARAIVIHGADYVSEDHVATWGKCGRSEGCFAVAPHIVPQLLGLLGQGRMLFAGKIGSA
ncbi:twin-arginine translocation pathway signal protein [Sphingobium sp. C100]|uniref:murein L,D-transpeptidase catalytic domain family protein n=1 Tax=Sphingobium sp. C100 TaxID=1207055 RepID=UPI0003D619F4|nr:murein L,D-transpeptidase catalytic domain family protein [Sphingobium sp. C100]ETI59027.1 twin-arginine translocation pathway signal protein [Sphingobium sp. C100]